MNRLIPVAFVVLFVVIADPASADRWLVERDAAAKVPLENAWAPAGVELTLRSKLAELRGVELASEEDVKSDVATLGLDRLSAPPKGEKRVEFGKFARARALIVIGVEGGGAVAIRAIDLAQGDREATFSVPLAADDLEGAAADVAARLAAFLNRAPSAAELARMKRPSGLSKDALALLAQSMDAKTSVEREGMLKQAAALSPRAPLTGYLYARELHASGRTLEAVSAYRGAIKLDGDEPRYHYDLGNAFFDEKRFGEAADEYARAIALDPAHAPSHENLVRALRAQKPDAADVLARYLKLAAAYEKSAAVVHLQAGRLLAEAGKFGEAAEAFRRATDMVPKDPVAHFDLAHALERAGKDGEAFYEYKEAIKLAPNYAKAHNNVAFLYEKMGKDQLALYYYQAAVKYAPDYALAWSNLGILYGKLGQHRLELEAFRNQVRLTPRDAAAHFNLGVACQCMGETQPAIAAYKKALELSPDDKLAHWQLAHAYERDGAWNLADQHWKKVLALDPTPEEKATAERHLKENEGR